MAYTLSPSSSSFVGSSSGHFGASGSSSSASHGIVTRSRTGLFLSYRDTAVRSTSGPGSYPPSSSQSRRAKGKGKARSMSSYRDDVDEQEEELGLLENGGKGADGEDLDLDDREGLPPEWVDEADKVDDILERVKPRLAQLDRLHAKHLLPGFKDRTQEERDIAQITGEITREFRKCQHLIARISSMSASLPPTTTRADRILLANVQTALATKVQSLSSVFRKKQSNYLKQLRGYELKSQDILAASGGSRTGRRSFEAAGSGGLPVDEKQSVEDDILLSEDTLATSSQYQHQQQQRQLLQSEHAPLSQAEISSRDKEITSIAESITDLAQLFNDLSHLVIDQGTMLDRIDYNIEQMDVDMEGAVKELNLASQYQRRSGKRQIICLLVLLIIGAVLILVYRWPKSGSGVPVPPDPAGQDALNGDNRILDPPEIAKFSGTSLLAVGASFGGQKW